VALEFFIIRRGTVIILGKNFAFKVFSKKFGKLERGTVCSLETGDESESSIGSNVNISFVSTKRNYIMEARIKSRTGANGQIGWHQSLESK
jgi:hypothetical protein